MTQIQTAKPLLTVAAKVWKQIRANNSGGPELPFSKRRPMGTLKHQFGWDPGSRKLGTEPALKQGAMPLYMNTIRLPRANGKTFQKRTGAQIYGALAVSIAFPSLRQDPTPDKHARKVFRKPWAAISEMWTNRAIQDLTSVRKEDDRFTVRVPFFYATSEVLSQLKAFYASPEGRADGDQLSDHLSSLQPGIIWSKTLPRTGGPFDRYLPLLQRIEGSFVEVRQLGSAWVFMLGIHFTQTEASTLCQTPWLQIRPIDFYALMHTWATGRLGSMRGDPPLYSIPLSRIARELPEGGQKRVSEDLSIMVDEKANYWWLEDQNNIAKFEDEYNRHLTRNDGTLCAVPSNPDESVAPKPKSALVFVDWINLKMAFINSEHRMEVVGLDRVVKANVTHYVKILRTKIASERGIQIISQTFNAAAATGFALGGDFNVKAWYADIQKYSMFYGQKLSDIEFLDLWTAVKDPFTVGPDNERDQFPRIQMELFFRAMDHVLSYAANPSTLDNLYAQYAFRTVSQLVAYLKILSTKLPEYENLKAQDNERRQAYTTQDQLDPEYELPSVPYMSEPDAEGNGGRALMPHQVRGAKRLAKSPNFAILAVDAGGGKTAACIFDYLKELGKGNIRRALIMCPPHLVAQYVKEFLYFTDSRINVIAVTTYTIRRHTLEGLARLLEQAPPNTVVVTDYDLARGKSKAPIMGYGPTPTRYYPVVEMLRSFAFDYVFCDESHFLKGTTSRQAAVARLISEIPYKRLASGTLAPNLITDLLQQIALLDPTVMPRGEFLAKYALEIKGNKVTKWKPGYEAELMAELKQNIVWVQTKRKEWAALLPKLKEESHFVDLTDNQQEVYDTILREVVDNLRKAAMNNAALRALIMGKPAGEEGGEEGDEGEGNGGDDDEEGGDEEDIETIDVDALLKPYLARLEQFVVAPGADVYGGTVLSGEDLLSPKVIQIEEIIRNHLAAGIPGKILIFTNYVASAEAIYNGFSPDIRKQTILYTASNKEADGARFERDEGKQIMVGVELSMNTGLNLQFCSRLIRVDSVWTPGSLEQGNSRIQRPNVKKAEHREFVYIDWVLGQRTIDITKQAFLLQKQVQIAKFDEADNPRFKAIPLPPAFPMSLDVIETSNSTTSEALIPYFESYAAVKYATFDEYDDYRRNHPEDLDPVTGLMRMSPLQRAPNLPNSSLMYRVPYVPGTELYKAEDLGLIRYDAYMKQDLEEEDDEGNEVEDEGQRAKSRAELEKMQGQAVHTEFGDGNIVGVSKKWLIVELSTGDRVKVSKIAVFLITRSQTNNKDQRELLLRQIGDIPFDKPFDVEVKDAQKTLLPKKKSQEEETQAPVDQRIAVSLSLYVTNDILGLMMDNATSNPEGAAALEAMGFHQPAPYFYAEMPTAEHMYRQFAKWAEHGFTFAKEHSEACKRTYIALKNARKNAATWVGVANAADLRNWYRLQNNVKPDPSRTVLYPYPLIEDDTLYLALPINGHPASKLAISHRVPGVRWYEEEVEDLRVVHAKSFAQLDAGIAKMLNQGIVITNIEELRKRRKRLVKHESVLDN